MPTRAPEKQHGKCHRGAGLGGGLAPEHEQRSQRRHRHREAHEQEDKDDPESLQRETATLLMQYALYQTLSDGGKATLGSDKGPLAYQDNMKKAPRMLIYLALGLWRGACTCPLLVRADANVEIAPTLSSSPTVPSRSGTTPPSSWRRVERTGSRDQAVRAGFGPLARYIFAPRA